MARILVVGSVARDEVVTLATPLVPGAHLDGMDRAPRIGGGAANTGGALVHAGHVVLPVAALGLDRTGDVLRDEMAALGFDLSLVHRIQGATTRSLVLVDPEGERTVINLTRAQEEEPPWRLVEAPADWVFVRSRAPGLGPLLRLKAAACRVVAHMPPFDDGGRPAHVMVASASDLSPAQRAAPFETGRRASGGLAEWVVMTDGAAGATAYGAGETIRVAARPVTPVDTTGAGDAFAAGLVHGLAMRRPMKEAVDIGCAFGAEATQWESSILPPEAVRFLLEDL